MSRPTRRRSPDSQMADAARQADLLAALRKATENPTAQLALVYVYGKQLGCAQRDIDAVQREIGGGSVRECAG